MKNMFLFLLLAILAEPIQMRTATYDFAILSQEPQSDEDPPKEINCGRILVRGSEQFTQTELCQLLDGAVGPQLDSESRNTVQSNIIKAYYRRGFLEAAVSWKEVERNADTSASITILMINEGRSYSLRRLEMMGNVNTRDRVIRRRVALQEGSVFDEELLELSIKRINQLGIFEEFTRDEVEVSINKKGHFIDLTFKLKEK